MEDDAIYEIEVRKDGRRKAVELLVPGDFIYEGDCYVDAHARCVGCGKMKFEAGEDDEMCDCDDGGYDYDESQHPVDLWLEEWVRDRYGPEAELGGFCRKFTFSPYPLGCRALMERLGCDRGILGDLTVEDMKIRLTAEQLAEAEHQAQEWKAERIALEAGRTVPKEAA